MSTDAYAPFVVRVLHNHVTGYTLNKSHIPPGRDLVIELPFDLPVRGARGACELHSLALAASLHAASVYVVGARYPVRQGLARVLASGLTVEVTHKGSKATSPIVRARPIVVPTAQATPSLRASLGLSL